MTAVTITGQKKKSSILADCLSDILAEVKSSSDSGDKINSNQAVGKSVFPITGLRGSFLWDWWGSGGVGLVALRLWGWDLVPRLGWLVPRMGFGCVCSPLVSAVFWAFLSGCS